MKIIQVHNYYPVRGGGEDTVVHTERQLLEQAGHMVIPYYVQTHEKHCLDRLKAALLMLWNPTTYHNVRSLLRETRPDIVHCHNTFPTISPSVYWACRRERVPVVQTLHNFRLICPSAFLLREGRPCELCISRKFAFPAVRHRCYRQSRIGSFLIALLLFLHKTIKTYSLCVTKFIVLSDFSKSLFLRGGFARPDTYETKPNFVSGDQIHLATRTTTQKQNRNPNARRILFLGRLSEEKGCETLVEAWNRASTPENWHLDIVGSGPDYDRLRDLDRSGKINFVGAVPHEEISNYLSKADLLVITSIWYEAGFPLSAIEAFAHGVPVMGPDMGNLSLPILIQGSDFLFSANDEKDLRAKLEQTLQCDARLKTAQRDAKAFFQSHYASSVNRAMLEVIYTKAIHTPPRTGQQEPIPQHNENLPTQREEL